MQALCNGVYFPNFWQSLHTYFVFFYFHVCSIFNYKPRGFILKLCFCIFSVGTHFNWLTVISCTVFFAATVYCCFRAGNLGAIAAKWTNWSYQQILIWLLPEMIWESVSAPGMAYLETDIMKPHCSPCLLSSPLSPWFKWPANQFCGGSHPDFQLCRLGCPLFGSFRAAASIAFAY